MTARIDALSKAVAEFMEPEPKSQRPDRMKIVGCVDFASPGGFWRRNIGEPWEPVSILDPAVSMRLLKELVQIPYFRPIGGFGLVLYTKKDEPLELAIAEAFCRANGLKIAANNALALAERLDSAL